MGGGAGAGWTCPFDGQRMVHVGSFIHDLIFEWPSYYLNWDPGSTNGWTTCGGLSAYDPSQYVKWYIFSNM